MVSDETTEEKCNQLKELIADAEASLKEISDSRESMTRTIAISGGWVLAIIGLISSKIVSPDDFSLPNAVPFPLRMAAGGCMVMAIVIIALVMQVLTLSGAQRWKGRAFIFQHGIERLTQAEFQNEQQRLEDRLQTYQNVLVEDSSVLKEMKKYYERIIFSLFLIMPVSYLFLVAGIVLNSFINHSH
ncbi:hypothetical protein ATPR_1803 [Acetobacter tropicalis NBRC 101654]|uniref:Uncharacterized protein n=1 Tax=Acetobacter tropicalis NBRC 101654 TaxID=749388 RepID=F7VEK4_9PROT|nr:hypothetical protein [Acetobacter tropicalis]GAA08799.1 hypothetical protein ATPR_1803 [Acetobacter tropicalis NBRC 101654]